MTGATLCDKVCQWLATDWCFFPGTPVSSTNKTDCHDIAEILLKVALNTITPNPLLMTRLCIFHVFIVNADCNFLCIYAQLYLYILFIKDEVLLTVSCPIFPSILIAKYLLTGSLKNRSIDNLETQKKYISMKNSQFFDYLLYAKSK
jgi:hypothetical protein